MFENDVLVMMGSVLRALARIEAHGMHRVDRPEPNIQDACEKSTDSAELNRPHSLCVGRVFKDDGPACPSAAVLIDADNTRASLLLNINKTRRSLIYNWRSHRSG